MYSYPKEEVLVPLRRGDLLMTFMVPHKSYGPEKSVSSLSSRGIAPMSSLVNLKAHYLSPYFLSCALSLTF